MHTALVAGCFLLLILVPCLVAMKSSSKEDKSGNSGEHVVPKAPRAARGHSPSRIRAAADALTARKAAKLAAEQGIVTSSSTERPSRIRMAAAALTVPLTEEATASDSVEQPSRIRMAATALTQRRAKGPVPMAGGDPGTRKLSIKELRAKQAAARVPRA